MAQFRRIEVANAMKETGMIPLFFNSDIELSKEVIKFPKYWNFNKNNITTK